jgi:hypothetical protein
VSMHIKFLHSAYFATLCYTAQWNGNAGYHLVVIAIVAESSHARLKLFAYPNYSQPRPSAPPLHLPECPRNLASNLQLRYKELTLHLGSSVLRVHGCLAVLSDLKPSMSHNCYSGFRRIIRHAENTASFHNSIRTGI